MYKSLIFGVFLLFSFSLCFTQDIIGPTGSSSQYGNSITVLPNGNFVLVDYNYNEGATLRVGAVYLFDGASKTLISTLKGSTTDDQIGRYGIRVLSNGNYIVKSPFWTNGTKTGAGAATWCSATTGVSGLVSTSNSLVGSTDWDYVGYDTIVELTNGNYVMSNPNWDNGSAVDAGAVTMADGTTGITGVINSGNSLVGTTSNDQVGNRGIKFLANGNYVVLSDRWNNAGITTGAVTWANGTTGITGAVSSANSLVGSSSFDNVGSSGFYELPNGNYVITIPYWDNGAFTDAGAVTWANGTTGITGLVSASNSLVGSKSSDIVGQSGVIFFPNSNYVIGSQSWDNAAITDAGAATWADGTTGITGVISAANSLVGSKASDMVGGNGLTNLKNGNYVIKTPNWDNGAVANVGAVTWASGSTGIVGTISSANSIIGSVANDQIGYSGVSVLTNGNYVIQSPYFDNGAIVNAGAATWADGTTGITGFVSASNSLVGSSTTDLLSNDGITCLTNGNYVINNSYWNNGAVVDAGAATWADGTTGISGTISSSNSLVGTSTNDRIGWSIALPNGNYVLQSSNWDNGALADVGASTWADGTSGIVGVISSANSLIGSTSGDRIGNVSITILTNSNYVINSSGWSNGAITYAGASTWADGTSGIVGIISSSNSLIGSAASDGVGYPSSVALSNGNYVVRSNGWDNGAISGAGAVTWGNGTSGTTGIVSSANSLVGSSTFDDIGSNDYPVSALSNGNYVVYSLRWNNGALSDAGSVTMGDGTIGISGTISSCNSIIGEQANDFAKFKFNSVYDYLIVGKTGSKKISISNQLTQINPTVSVSSDDADNSICDGTTVIFSATPTNGGTNPIYQWKKNATIVGTNSSSYTSSSLANGDVITVKFSSDASTCSASSTGITMTVNLIPTADAPGNVTACDTYTLPSLTVGNYFTGTGGTGTALSAGNSITSSQTIYVYAETGTTPNCTDENSFTVTINTTPTADAPSNVTACDSYTLPALTVGNYFTGTGGTGTALSAGNSITSSQTIYVYAETGTTPNCTDENSFTVTINTTPTADAPSNVTACDTYTLPSLTVGNYFTGTGGTGTALSAGNSITSSQTIYVYAETGTTPNCTDENSFTVTINTTPTADAPSNVTACDSYTLPALTVGNYYTGTGGTGTALSAGNSITSSQTIYVYAETGTTPNCTDENSFTVTINTTPTADAPSNVTACDSYTLPALTVGNYFTGTGGTGTALSAGNSITSSQTIYVYAETGTTPNCTDENSFVVTIEDCSQLTTGSCGASLITMGDALYSDAVAGATNYRYWVQNATTGYSYISVRAASDNLFRMSWLTANTVKYGTTYTVRVSAYVAGAWQSYGTPCNVTTPPTRLQPSSCGITITNMTDAIYCYPVVGATSYRFQVVHAGSSFNKIATSNVLNNNFFRMSWFSSDVIPGATYTVTVQAYANGSWSAYGPSCTITTPSTLTKLATASCDISIPTLSTALYSDAVAGATNFRYEVVNVGAGFNKVSVRAASDNLFRLSWLTGIQLNTTYTIRVSAYLNGIWQAYGTACTVTTPAAIMADEEIVLEHNNGLSLGEELVLKTFPNPNTGSFTVSTNAAGRFKLVNELGQLIQTLEITEENAFQTKVEGLGAGVYFVTGIVNETVLTKKIVVQ